MSDIFSYIWNIITTAFQTISTNIQAFINQIWNLLSGIPDIARAILSGFLYIAERIWSAVYYAYKVLSDAISSAYNYVSNALQKLASAVGDAISWVGSGISWIGNQLYNFGSWIWNSLVYIYNYIVNLVIGIWNNIVNWFGGISKAINTWWSNTVNSINSWFTNLLLRFRKKLIDTIRADITIAMAWKNGERLLTASNTKDIVFALLGMFMSPVIGHVVGTIVNSVVPIPSTTTYNLIPSLSSIEYTPSTLNVTQPTGLTLPQLGNIPAYPGYFTGIQENRLTISSSVEGYTTSQDISTPQTINLNYEIQLT